MQDSSHPYSLIYAKFLIAQGAELYPDEAYGCECGFQLLCKFGPERLPEIIKSLFPVNSPYLERRLFLMQLWGALYMHPQVAIVAEPLKQWIIANSFLLQDERSDAVARDDLEWLSYATMCEQEVVRRPVMPFEQPSSSHVVCSDSVCDFRYSPEAIVNILHEAGRLKAAVNCGLQVLLNNTYSIAEWVERVTAPCDIYRKERLQIRLRYFDTLKKVVLTLLPKDKSFLHDRYSYPLIKCIDANRILAKPTLFTILLFQCATPLAPIEERKNDREFLKQVIRGMDLMSYEWQELCNSIKESLSGRDGWSDLPTHFGRTQACNLIEYAQEVYNEMKQEIVS